MNCQKTNLFDISDDSFLNSISTNEFVLNKQQYLLDFLVKYNDSNLTNSFLIATNVPKAVFKSTIKSIECENINKINGELDLIINFHEIKNIPDLKQLKYTLTGFLKQININQYYVTVDKNFFGFIKKFNQQYIANNQLVDDVNIINELRKLIVKNIEAIFLFDSDQLIKSKIFSVSTNKEFFISQLLSSNLEINMLANLGIINVKIPLKKHLGISLNNIELTPNNSYLEFNISGYNKNYQTQILKNEIICNANEWSLTDINEINKQWVIDHFITCYDNKPKFSLVNTKLTKSELMNYFIDSFNIDDATSCLGLVSINLVFTPNFANSDNLTLKINIIGFDNLINTSLYQIKSNNIDISNNNKFNQMSANDFSVNDFINHFVGFNSNQQKDKMIIFNCSKNIFEQFIYINSSISANDNQCVINLSLNVDPFNDLTNKLTNNSKVINLTFNIKGFYVNDNSLIIIISVVVCSILLILIILSLILYFRRKKKVIEINKEQQFL